MDMAGLMVSGGQCNINGLIFNLAFETLCLKLCLLFTDERFNSSPDCIRCSADNRTLP